MTRLTLPLLTVALIVGAFAVANHAQMANPMPEAGLWHLVPADTDEQAIPNHRVDIRLYPTPAPFRAAMVNRQTNADMPYAVATFDGRRLRLQMRAEAGRTQAEMPWLSMDWNGSRFDGTFLEPNGAPTEGSITLKLIRGVAR